jgi:hypothetical protein
MCDANLRVALGTRHPQRWLNRKSAHSAMTCNVVLGDKSGIDHKEQVSVVRGIENVPLTRISEIIDSGLENQLFLIDDAREFVLQPQGWQHF